MHGFRRVLLGLCPPVEEGCLESWWSTRHAHPSQNLMSYLMGEGVADDQVIHRLGSLVAKEASGVVLQVPSR